MAIRSSPAFAATAVAALAVGIGANTAIFSVVSAVLPLSYPDPDRIVLFYQTTPAEPSYGASAAKFNALRQLTGAFQDVSAYEYTAASLNLTGGVLPEQAGGFASRQIISACSARPSSRAVPSLPQRIGQTARASLFSAMACGAVVSRPTRALPEK